MDLWYFLSLSCSSPGSKRVTEVARAGCRSVGVAAAEEQGPEVKQVCWLAGFEVISIVTSKFFTLTKGMLPLF